MLEEKTTISVVGNFQLPYEVLDYSQIEKLTFNSVGEKIVTKQNDDFIKYSQKGFCEIVLIKRGEYHKFKYNYKTKELTVSYNSFNFSSMYIWDTDDNLIKMFKNSENQDVELVLYRHNEREHHQVWYSRLDKLYYQDPGSKKLLGSKQQVIQYYNDILNNPDGHSKFIHSVAEAFVNAITYHYP